MTYWPTDAQGKPFTGPIRLHEQYEPSTHDYLNSLAARELFDIPVRWIKQMDSHRIVSAGCGMGHINEYLQDWYPYTYFGFDTASKVIDAAKLKYENRPNIKFVTASWNNEDAIRVDYPVDCLLLMGVLTYGLPQYGFAETNGSPEQIFDRLVRLYRPRHVIIRETRADQIHVDQGNQLHTVDLSYFKQFPHEEIHVDVNMWIGNKVLLNVTC